MYVCSVRVCVGARAFVCLYRVFASCCSHAGGVCYQWYNVDVHLSVALMWLFEMFFVKNFSVPFFSKVSVGC